MHKFLYYALRIHLLFKYPNILIIQIYFYEFYDFFMIYFERTIKLIILCTHFIKKILNYDNFYEIIIYIKKNNELFLLVFTENFLHMLRS